MSIDINKIITESIQETMDVSNDDIKPISENVVDDVDENQYDHETVENDFDPAIASSISAGLGALTFRNHYRAINEAMTDETKAKLKKAGKVAAGVGALAGVAGTAYAKRDELGNMAKTTGKAVKKFFNRDNSTPVKTKYTNHITI